MSFLRAPSWIQTFYSKFPLVVLEQEDAEYEEKGECSLWIQPPVGPHPHHREWASTNPTSLRTQLLFLLRGVPVEFKRWENEASAPGEQLPALHLPREGRILTTGEIRGWLDERYDKEFNGMRDQAAYDRGLAVAQLVLGRLYPACMARTPTFHLLFPNPPPLLAGLTTPLPASLTGDSRNVDEEEVMRKGMAAIEVLDTLVAGSTWALDASGPTSLDALIASHLYAVFGSDSQLRTSLEEKKGLVEYLDRVLDQAERAMRK